MALFSKSTPAHSLAVMCVLRKINTVEPQNTGQAGIWTLFHQSEVWKVSYKASPHLSPSPGDLSLVYQYKPQQLLLSVDSWYLLVAVKTGHSQLSTPFSSYLMEVEICFMASNRYCCLVASASPDKIIIVGRRLGINLDIVEECIFV